jgi:tetratricopeptide (TPR) repeat protein
MSLPLRHEWIVAPFRVDRAAAPRCKDAEWHEIDAHCNFRGVYTAAAGVIRRLLEDTSVLAPDLLTQYQLTLLSVCPEAERQIPVSGEVADWLRISREGNARSWTLRLAHGLADFLAAYGARRPAIRLAICFENVDRSDPLDQEFVSVLLRRADPARLLVRVCSSSDQLGDALRSALKTHAQATIVEAVGGGSKIPEPWRVWLKRVAAGWAGEWGALEEISRWVDLSAMEPPACTLPGFLIDIAERLPAAERLRLGGEYVESECTSDRLVLKYVYAGAPAEERQALHRARAAMLEASNRNDLTLGAIPLHYEKGWADVEPLVTASKRCMDLGYYHAALDWAMRGRNMIATAPRRKSYSDLTRNALFSLLLLGRFDEVEAMCDENMAQSTDPALLAHTTYARAILTARLYDPPRRDFDAARAWVEKSLAFTEILAPSESRAVNLAFLRNTLALVEMRTGRPATAYELLTAALDYIAKEAPGKYPQECVLLLHNRARLQVALRQTDGAMADLTELLRYQPGDSEAHLDRGVLYQRAGRYEEALNDYNAAIRWSPPYREPYFNRAQTLVALGRRDEALADYNYVLTLAPNYVEALNNRACLFYDRGMFGAARSDTDTALRASPRHAQLLCLRGLCELKDGNPAAAYASFTESIQVDASLADAWANRASAQIKRGDTEGALLDLTHALSLRKDASAFYNRGRIYEAQKKWAAAIEDYSQALRLERGDARHLLERLRLCQNLGTYIGLVVSPWLLGSPP